ncbi:MAG: hypothetical protein IKZ07_06305 [Akkermansia sp.]|nr:hypothetical protein [Akkermansia sp.]
MSLSSYFCKLDAVSGDNDVIALWKNMFAIHEWFENYCDDKYDYSDYYAYYNGNDENDDKGYTVRKNDMEALKKLCEELISKVFGDDVDYRSLRKNLSDRLAELDGFSPDVQEFLNENFSDTMGLQDYDEWFFSDILDIIKVMDKELNDTSVCRYSYCYSY